jgi:hypothetical protein
MRAIWGWRGSFRWSELPKASLVRIIIFSANLMRGSDD